MMLVLDERRVYRSVAFPASAFDALQRLKRLWQMETNAEVLTRLLLANDPDRVMKNDDDRRTADRPDR